MLKEDRKTINARNANNEKNIERETFRYDDQHNQSYLDISNSRTLKED